MTAASIPTPAPEGIPFGPTAICSIGPNLSYRGIAVEELVSSSNFLETAYLVFHGELPSQEQFADLQAVVSEALVLDDDISDCLERLPLNASPIDVIRTGVNLLALTDAYEEEVSAGDVWETLQRLLAQLPLMLIARHRLQHGWSHFEFRDDLSFAGNLLLGLTDRDPTSVAEHALDAFLILSAEHELAPSTVAARVVASTRADFLSATIAGICAMKGIWHGGPGRQAIDILEAVEIPGAAARIVEAVLKQYERLPGFWHRVYRTSDPRSELLRPLCRNLAEHVGMRQMEDVAAAIETAVWDIQQILPSFDWPAARLLHYLGMDSELFVPLFVIARCAGWAAHFNEQQKTPQPIRPRAQYDGPANRSYIPLAERG